MPGPFDVADTAAYAAWRERKLADHPRQLEDLIVEVGDPRDLTAAERAALADRVRRCNMAIYAGGTREILRAAAPATTSGEPPSATAAPAAAPPAAPAAPAPAAPARRLP